MSVLSSMHFYFSSESTSCFICQYASATFPFGSCLYHRNKGTKKQSALTENTSIKTNCSLFTLIIFSEHTYFLRKLWITPKWKQRKKIYFHSICTPLEHLNNPQSLYLWAFSQFCPLLKLGKSKDILKYICLSFISFLPLFYFCYIYYFGSLIFCCQFFANFIITVLNLLRNHYFENMPQTIPFLHPLHLLLHSQLSLHK